MLFRQYSILLLLFLCGCEKYSLSVKREYVDQSTLASTFVQSPDLRQKNPPQGELLFIKWRLPEEALKEELHLSLKIIYQNHTQESLSYPVFQKRGGVTYSLLNEKYQETQGFLTYKAELLNGAGTVLREWQQQLWVERIMLDDM